jgi:hypothetical protein
MKTSSKGTGQSFNAASYASRYSASASGEVKTGILLDMMILQVPPSASCARGIQDKQWGYLIKN